MTDRGSLCLIGNSPPKGAVRKSNPQKAEITEPWCSHSSELAAAHGKVPTAGLFPSLFLHIPQGTICSKGASLGTTPLFLFGHLFPIFRSQLEGSASGTVLLCCLTGSSATDSTLTCFAAGKQEKVAAHRQNVHIFC